MNQSGRRLRLKSAAFALLLSLSLNASVQRNDQTKDGTSAQKTSRAFEDAGVQEMLDSGNIDTSLLRSLNIVGYAEASNIGHQSILGGGLVKFDTSTAPHTSNITPPASNGTTFNLIEAGTYLIMFHVRGAPDQLTPPHPLIFEVAANGTAIAASQFAADNQTTSLSSSGSEQVNGFAIATLPAHTTIQLRNITNSQTSVVTLHASVVGFPVVNAVLTILRLNV